MSGAPPAVQPACVHSGPPRSIETAVAVVGLRLDLLRREIEELQSRQAVAPLEADECARHAW